jgi:hypothetical protein
MKRALLMQFLTTAGLKICVEKLSGGWAFLICDMQVCKVITQESPLPCIMQMKCHLPEVQPGHRYFT